MLGWPRGVRDACARLHDRADTIDPYGGSLEAFPERQRSCQGVRKGEPVPTDERARRTGNGVWCPLGGIWSQRISGGSPTTLEMTSTKLTVLAVDSSSQSPTPPSVAMYVLTLEDLTMFLAPAASRFFSR